ncbi:hypothetical protein MM239_13465 [Belliella sp. DSM 111904]|uniref:HNH endonuclease n=1 Tax=Belliella filtrata TaxID=2923435 RepID=A0ABS9V338_9BACT|nr:hypothetical protein [Belliella filtrata]MCH7410410.1 hypothetical protein [Belliella filtrata]
MKLITSRPYLRFEIDKVFAQVKAAMHAEALKRGNGWALYEDCYTGQTLIGGDPYDYEHIFSAEWIHSEYKHLLSDEEIAKVVNCPENVAVTLRTINQSKGKTDPETWLANKQNIIKHQINSKLALKHIKRAKNAIRSYVDTLINE